MAPLRGMDIIECRANPVGGALMRPWLNSGVVECRAGIGQGAINGAPTGGWILSNVVRTPQGRIYAPLVKSRRR
ncbi:MAG: hypothetical protein K0S95_1169 [Pantoea eucrina]|jgi:hypothetical protein|nr:hypothetical protein [Pantoea eucrina]